MTIDEMRKRLTDFCNDRCENGECFKCPVREFNFANCIFKTYLPYQIKLVYNAIFGGKEMTIEEKKNRLREHCDTQNGCHGCPILPITFEDCAFCDFTDEEIEKYYDLVFGGEKEVSEKDCKDCRYADYGEDDKPCRDCKDYNMFVSRVKTVEQPKEEVNHPDRYAGGKFECIDVMQDVFGMDTVKHFCILNAFKYLWRSEKKNGVEDIRKAIWYLNKYIELGCEE